LLNQKLGYFLKRHRDAKILYFDTYLALDNLIKNAKEGRPTVVDGQAFYFNNVTDYACTFPAGEPPLSLYCTGEIGPNYLFADLVHPTDEAHRVLSLEVERQMRLWK
jgi:outer membrane lipase/esterase